MPKFLTISPTHIPGKKPYAWGKFRDGNYVAIGWLGSHDLTGKTEEEIEELIKAENYENELSAIKSFSNFMSIEIGDIVGINNVSFGLFGVGKIISGYKYSRNMHDTGSEEEEKEFYSHYRDVKWLVTEYKRKEELLRIDEKLWQPYGTTGVLEPDLPAYIKRLLNMPVAEKSKPQEAIKPDFLAQVIEYISVLRRDKAHKERAHESLVEDFFCALGYEKHKHIKYQQGRLDITLSDDERPVLLVEVKKDWDLSVETHINAVNQAFRYSLEKGIRFIVLTNGDYYALYDRFKGLSIESNLVGVFQLSQLEDEDMGLVDRLKIENLFRTDIREVLIHFSESF
jgi:hypothetical protein